MGLLDTVKLVAHFIAAQLLGIIMFYVGLRSYLALNANWTSTHMFIGLNEKSGMTAWRDSSSLGELLDCVLSNAYVMISSISEEPFNPACIGPVGTASMYGWNGTPYNNFLSIINFTGLGLVFAFITILVVELCASGATNIGQGKYLAFTYKVQNLKAFRILSWTLVLFVAMLICDTIRFLVYLYQNGYSGYLINFAEFLLPTLLTLGFSAYSLGSAKVDPFFDYETDEFKKLQFSRSWGDVATDNNAFALQLGLALLKQKRGTTKELEAMLADWMEPKCSSIDEVVKTCDKASEKDALL